MNFSFNTELVFFYLPAPEPPTSLSVKRGPLNDTIELSWSGPDNGDYDDFSLQWTPADQLTVTRTYLTSSVVAGMFPGRQYNFTLMAVSGGGAKGGPKVKSQPIQRNVRTSRWSCDGGGRKKDIFTTQSNAEYRQKMFIFQS